MTLLLAIRLFFVILNYCLLLYEIITSIRIYIRDYLLFGGKS